MSHSHQPTTSIEISPPTKAKTSSETNLQSMLGDSQLRMYLTAGAAAGVMEHSIMYPVDSIKTRMQSLRPHPNASYSSVFQAMRKITSTEGLLRPLRGVNVVIAGAGPAHALYFSSYEFSKKILGSTGNFPLANAASGVIATVFHDGTMNPIEVIKQRLQVYNSPYRGAVHCATTVLRTEGIGAFYRSFTTQLTMNIPFQCCHFVCYEYFRELLNPAGGYNPHTHLISGGLAGGIAAAVTTPLDVAKTLLNTQEKGAVHKQCSKGVKKNRQYIHGMVCALKTIHNLQGASGYFRGLRARVIYATPSCAISWGVYEFFKNSLSLQITDEELMDLTV